MLWQRGYCAATEFSHDTPHACAGDKGSWSIHSVRQQSACLRRCLSCDRCYFVSLSPADGDCSWYRSCELSALHTDSAHHRTARVRDATGQALPAVGALLAELDAAEANKTAFTWRHASPGHAVVREAAKVGLGKPRVGYCTLTLIGHENDCSAGDLGTWAKDTPQSLEACAERCRGCARCAVLSYSHTNRDCSWYSECDLDDLRRPPKNAGDYISARLRAAPAAVPPVSPAPLRPRVAVTTLLLGDSVACAMVQWCEKVELYRAALARIGWAAEM